MAEWINQSVIVKKSHPLVKSEKDAEEIARKYADRIYTSRETESSYRFRQMDDDKFSKFRTKVINKYVSIVYGLLKPRSDVVAPARMN
jgi:predicted nucleotide-binding protein (sugar kinase/HSP70/actin superfamily)